MVIEKIILRNYRCYYGERVLTFGEGLNVVVGDNGDGKSNLLNAFRWVLKPFESSMEGEVLNVSLKLWRTLEAGGSNEVSVELTFTHAEQHYCLRKTLGVRKGDDDTLSHRCLQPFDYTLTGDKPSGERVQLEVSEMDNIFDSTLRNYSLFSGEQQLEAVLDNSEALQYLVGKYSEIKDFQRYTAFTSYAREQSEKARDSQLKGNNKTKNEATKLKKEIDELSLRVNNQRSKVDDKRKIVNETTERINSFVGDQNTAEALRKLNEKIAGVVQQREAKQREIDMDYSLRLLDEQWILAPFANVLSEFAAKVATVDEAKRRAEAERQRNAGAAEALETVQGRLDPGVTALAYNVPTEAAMAEMLNDHVCKVCGTRAPEGSQQYQFMKLKLEELREHLKKSQGYAPKYRYVEELVSLRTVLDDRREMLSRLPACIDEELNRNALLTSEVRRLEEREKELTDKKAQLLAQGGKPEQEYNNTYNNLQGWFATKSEAETDLAKLETELEAMELTLKEKEAAIQKLGEDQVVLEPIMKACKALNLINAAFLQAKRDNRLEFIRRLETLANDFLCRLNVDGFRGIIHIRALDDVRVESSLVNSDESLVGAANTALQITKNLAILFAVRQLTTQAKSGNDYPLLLDAPTSSLAAGKQALFYNLIGNLGKQTIIATKEMLMVGEGGRSVLDRHKLDDIHATKWHIHKRVPFKADDQATIEILVDKIP